MLRAPTQKALWGSKLLHTTEIFMVFFAHQIHGFMYYDNRVFSEDDVKEP